MPDVVMPRLSESMEEGTILKWLVADGAQVARGQEIAEIETDKATVSFEADADGVLSIVAAEGETLPTGTIIARIGGEAGAAPAGAAGDGGAAPAPPAAATAKGAVTVEEPARAQQLVARRTAESRATVPHVTLAATVDMQECAALLERLAAGAGAGEAVPTSTDLVVKACAIALREHPRANAAYRDARFELFERVNVGVVVPAPDAMLAPTIFDADRKALAQIAAETAALSERVRDGLITPPELSGATFTVSDLGAFGITRFEAVITPPQAAALAVGAIEERAVARDGHLVARRTMDATLTCDHRILYGAGAAAFLARVRELLEQPLTLTL